VTYLSPGARSAHGGVVHHPPARRDLVQLDALEQRLGHAPHAVLEVAADASIAEICEAFATLVHACEPSRFTDPAAVARARRTMRHLRTAFRAAIGRELAPRPVRCTRSRRAPLT
jgi:hypothetical protein